MGRVKLFLLLITIGLAFIVVYLLVSSPEDASPTEPVSQNGEESTAQSSTSAPRPTRTPEPLYPTRTPGRQPESQPERSDVGRTPLTPPQPDVDPCPLSECLSSFGVSGSGDMADLSYQAGLPFNAYLSWSVEDNPARPGGVEFWQLVNVDKDGPRVSRESIAQATASLPGSIWVIGNEPDVIWQNNTPPDRYAQIYHDLYMFIKEQDPSAQVAIGGVAQPTPLRLQYLDLVLETYSSRYGQPMPVDIWTIHGFVLQELTGSWGVEIPPGLQATQGELYTIQDHGNLEIFKQNLIDFRAWMAERGYRDKPLALTEFGILLPTDYGFPEEDVAAFMTGALDFLVTTANATGYPPEDGRLVQWWFWFSIHDANGYQTGDLYDPSMGRLTYLGQTYAAYFRGLAGVGP